MTKDMRSAKARVLEVYLEAFDSMLGIGIYNMPRYRAEAVGVEQKIIGEDWIDAASRLPAEPKVETIEQIFDRHDEVFRNHAMNDSYPEEAEGGGVEQPLLKCWACDVPIEPCGKTGWLHVGALDDEFDHEAHPVGRKSNDRNDPKEVAPKRPQRTETFGGDCYKPKEVEAYMDALESRNAELERMNKALGEGFACGYAQAVQDHKEERLR